MPTAESPPRLCGLLIQFEDDSSPKLRAPLKSISVNSKTCGPIAHNTIKFTYKNDNKTAITSKFVFPVNNLSAIYFLEAIVGDKKIVGQVKEKNKATKEFNDAVKEGKTAVLAKESDESGDIIELEIGAFPENETAVITVKEVFEMKLIKDATAFRYKFPTSLFVRYSGDKEKKPSATQTVERSTISDYSLNFQLTDYSNVKFIKPLSWLKTFSTDGSMFKFNDNRDVFKKDHDVILELNLKEDFKGFSMNEDFYDPTIIQDTILPDKQITFSSFLIKIPNTAIEDLPAKEYIFVIDCSASMYGSRIEEAKKTLQQLINSLPIGSYFNIYRFGSTFQSLFKKSKEYTAETKKIAINLATTMSADLGGTEMLNCLKKILTAENCIPKYKKQVFVLTDGGISNQEETLNMVHKNQANNRIFSFGIGAGASSSLVNGLADKSKGYASFISSKDDGNRMHGLPTKCETKTEENMAEICISAILASAGNYITKVNFSDKENLIWPKIENIGALCDSTCLNSFIKKDIFQEEFNSKNEKPYIELEMSDNKENLTKIKNELSSENYSKIINPFEKNVLHKLLAKKQILELNKIVNDNPYDNSYNEIKEKIINLSETENVLSAFTALVGVCDSKIVTGSSQRIDVSNVYDGNIYAQRRNMYAMQSCSISPKSCSYSRPNRIHALYCAPPPIAYAHCSTTNKIESLSSQTSADLVVFTTKPNTYQEITNVQDPLGFWIENLSYTNFTKLAEKISQKTKDLKAPVTNTLLAVAILIIEFLSEFNEWKVSIKRGISFLKKEIKEFDEDFLLDLIREEINEDDEDVMSVVETCFY